MITLQSSSQSLQATLTAGVSTTALEIGIVYYDDLPQARSDMRPRYGTQESTVSSATVTTVCNAPGDGIVRNIINIFGFDADVTSATLQFNKLAGVTSTRIKKATLTTGQTLWYEHGDGWEVL